MLLLCEVRCISDFWFAAARGCFDKSRHSIDLHLPNINAAMRAGILPRSPRTVACALIAVFVCFFVPFKLSRDSEVLDSVEQPAHLTCSGAPVRKTTSWLPGKAGALTDLHTDEKTVKHYIDKCVLPSRIAEEEVTGSGAKVGIAIPAGGKWLLSNTLAVCTVLRKTLKSALLVEVVYNGPEEYDELLVSQLEVSWSFTICTHIWG